MLQPAMDPKIAILIPVHNGIEFTRKCLQNLHEALYGREEIPQAYKIVVIDDGSTDGTAEWITASYPECTLLKGSGSLWWSGAINAGARWAIEIWNADYLVLWNNDIVIPGDYFQVLNRILQEYDQNTIVGSKIYADKAFRTLWSAGGQFNPRTGKKYMKGYYQPDGEAYDHPLEADWLTGMGTIVPRQVVEKTGYWDNRNFPQYYGDTDFTLRAKNLGCRIIVHPDLKISNDAGNSGIKTANTFHELMTALKSIKSLHNLNINLKFYRKHARSPRAYLHLMDDYFRLTGGFLKRWVFRKEKLSRINKPNWVG
jgi:hypothetical protein